MADQAPGPPLNFEQWVHCITKKCGIPLTQEFLDERAKAMSDASNPETKKFEQLYGKDYRELVTSWIEYARVLLEAGALPQTTA